MFFWFSTTTGKPDHWPLQGAQVEQAEQLYEALKEVHAERHFSFFFLWFNV